MSSPFRAGALALVGIVCQAALLTACAEPAPPPAYPTTVTAAEYGPPGVPPPEEVEIGVDGDSYADTDPSALSDFHTTLDPYGTWVEDSAYGTVWVPSPDQVGPDFTPYVTAGHWAYDDEYVWVSDYSWGWVPFHYGRWVWVAGRGWAWVPGRTYAGAWVIWRTDADLGYVGWAPMPPLWIWRGGVAVGIRFVPWEPYTFCRRGDIFSPVVASRVVVAPRAEGIATRTRPYVRAAPSAAGHPLAQPRMLGPPPAALGVAPAAVPHVSPMDRSTVRAQQFARPSTAQPLGARPAAPHVVQSAPMVMPPVRRTLPAGSGRIPAGGRRR